MKDIKLIFLCVGGRHHSSTISIECDITKTGQKITLGKYVHCNTTKLNDCW